MSVAAQVERGDVDVAPTFEKSCIRFEIRDGMRRVSCAVSDEALDAASGLTEPSTPGMRRRSFDRFRTLIHAAALLRLGARSPECRDPILVTSRDLRQVPLENGSPKFGTAGRSPTNASALEANADAPSEELA